MDEDIGGVGVGDMGLKYPKDFINKIICGDCLEVMKEIPDKSVDLVVTSPPYDNLRDYAGYTFDFGRIAKELFRILKQGGVVVWVVGDATIDGSETGTSFRQVLYFKSVGFSLHDTMLYEKNTPSMPDSNRYGQTFEYMFILVKGSPKTVNLLKDKVNRWAGEMSFGRVSRRTKSGELRRTGQIKTGEVGVRFNIWRYNTGLNYSTKDKIAFNHPAIFPEALASDHIQSWSNPNDIVLDPMCGSGTTCKMAKLLNRKFIGIEINPEYCQIAERRLAQEVFKL